MGQNIPLLCPNNTPCYDTKINDLNQRIVTFVLTIYVVKEFSC